jgi:hypothetical protein
MIDPGNLGDIQTRTGQQLCTDILYPLNKLYHSAFIKQKGHFEFSANFRKISKHSFYQILNHYRIPVQITVLTELYSITKP